MAELVNGATKLRAKDDPFLTNVCPRLGSSSCSVTDVARPIGVGSHSAQGIPVVGPEVCLLMSSLAQGTNSYWNSWIRKSTYEGSWKEAVHRSALALKLLIYEPTGMVLNRISAVF